MGRTMLLLLFVGSTILTTATEVVEVAESNLVQEKIETADEEVQSPLNGLEVAEPIGVAKEAHGAAEASLTVKSSIGEQKGEPDEVAVKVEKELSESEEVAEKVEELEEVEEIDDDSLTARSSSTGSAGEEEQTSDKNAAESPADAELEENEETGVPDARSVVGTRKSNCSNAAEGRSVVDPKRAHHPNPNTICPSDIRCHEGELCVMHANYPSCYHPQRACHYLPCQHGGTCQLNFQCLCVSGYTGSFCERSAPSCNLVCYNQGTCTLNNRGQASCRCALGFSGTNCQTPVNNPVCNIVCYNQGTCVLDGFGVSSCQCALGFGGTNCQTPDNTPVCNLFCYNQGTCILDAFGRSSCQCAFGFGGTNCQTPDTVCNLVCYNQGTCILDGFGRSSCQCAFGFSGTNCQKPDNNPVCNLVCYNQGTCVLNSYGLSSCECTLGFSGTNCQTADPICNLVCYNQGTCTFDSFGVSRCTCSAGFTGPQCAQALPSCNLNCYNQGFCTFDSYGQPRCECQSGYSGTYCQTPPSFCSLNCLNGGTCSKDIYGQQSCQCIPPWGGLLCDRPVDNPLCDAVNCEGDCVCQESCRHEDGYVCVSDLGYLGRLCNIPIPDLECTSDEIVLSVSQLFYAEWDMNQRNSIIYMSPTVDGEGSNLQQCQAQLVGSTYRIAISHPFTQCGTQTTTEVGTDGYNRISFTNALWINKRIATTASYDMPFGIIRFKCVYGNSYTIYTSIRPLIDEPPVITEEQDYHVSASLCKVSTCNAVCPASLTMQQSAVYTVGQVLHLDFGLTNINNPIVFNNLPVGVETIVDYVFLSCSSSTPLVSNGLTLQNPQIALFQQGCPTDHGLALQAVMGSSTLNNRACISFRLPRSKVCAELYIHARLHVCTGVLQQAACPSGAMAPRCTQVRRKRSASADQGGSTNPITIGPIYVLDKEEGDSHVTFLVDGAEFKMKTNSHRNSTVHEIKKLPKRPQKPKVLLTVPHKRRPATGVKLILLITALAISFVVLTLASVLFVHRRRSATKPDSLGL